jgi:secreted trypsin-like serine protease
VVGCTKSNSDSNDPSQNACGTIGLTTRVFNGTECQIDGSPVVNVTLLPTDGGVVICSGTLVTPNTVLTSAHCFENEIRSGSILAGDQDIPMQTVKIHPNYNGESVPSQNDVALITLQFPAPVRSLPLVLSRGIRTGDVIGVYGFGESASDNNSNGRLRSGEMVVEGINSQFFFAKFSDRGSRICQGDSGGPAIVQFSDQNGNTRTGIVGVTSFAEAGCSAEGVSGFQNIQSSAVLDFILTEIPGIPTI